MGDQPDVVGVREDRTDRGAVQVLHAAEVERQYPAARGGFGDGRVSASSNVSTLLRSISPVAVNTSFPSLDRAVSRVSEVRHQVILADK